MNHPFHGTITALITPFKNDGSLDLEGWTKNLRTQAEAGVDGVVVLGTTGESPAVSDDERSLLIQSAVEELKGRTAVIVGSGANCTTKAMQWTQQAQQLGADGALVVTPYYNKPTQEGMIQYYTAITAAAPSFPLCLYNVPGRTGVSLLPATVRALLAVPSIVAIKEASGSLAQIDEILQIIHLERPDFSLLSGDDALTLPIIALGGSGVISVISNLLPRPIVEYVRSAREGKFVLCREWHRRLLPYMQAAFFESNPIPIKWAMERAGLPAGPCREPLTPLSKKYHAQWEELLHSLAQARASAAW